MGVIWFISFLIQMSAIIEFNSNEGKTILQQQNQAKVYHSLLRQLETKHL